MPTQSHNEPFQKTHKEGKTINMINISPVLNSFVSKCAENRENVNHVNFMFICPKMAKTGKMLIMLIFRGLWG